jgi:hypothetical protein
MLDGSAGSSHVSETGGVMTMEFELPDLRPERPLRPAIRRTALYATQSRVARGRLKHRPREVSGSAAFPPPMAHRTRSNPNIAWIDDALDRGSS